MDCMHACMFRPKSILSETNDLIHFKITRKLVKKHFSNNFATAGWIEMGRNSEGDLGFATFGIGKTYYLFWMQELKIERRRVRKESDFRLKSNIRLFIPKGSKVKFPFFFIFFHAWRS
jgi:hypothetical protein